jgi:hypothetical protein
LQADTNKVVKLKTYRLVMYKQHQNKTIYQN